MNSDRKKILTTAGIAAAIGLIILIISLAIPEGPNPDIRIHSVKASGKLNRYYPEKKMTDGKKTTAWVSISKNFGKFEWIRFRFTDRISLKKIRMINGYSKKHKNRWIGDLYDRYSRIRSVRIRLSDNSSYFWILKDNKRSFQTFSFPEPRKTTSITLYIHNIYKGTYNKSVAISEIQFL